MQALPDQEERAAQPHHVCVVCRDTIEKFVDLRNLAVKNEELFIKSSNVNKERIGNQVKVE